MTNIDEALKTLKAELDNSSVIKEYLRLKEVIENDEDLKSMRKEIARLTNENKKEEHDALLEIYNSHPIVVNYQLAREEVVSLLSQIKDVLSD